MSTNEEMEVNQLNDENDTVTPENEEIEVNLEVDDEPQEETVTIPKNEYTELIAKKEHWKKKAQEGSRPKTDTPKTEDNKETALSPFDTIAILKANVDVEEIPELTRMAKLMNVSVSEALKSKAVINILNEKKEERNSANAINIGTSRRTPQKQSDESLLENARNGKLPESEADIERLVQVRMASKR